MHADTDGAPPRRSHSEDEVPGTHPIIPQTGLPILSLMSVENGGKGSESLPPGECVVNAFPTHPVQTVFYETVSNEVVVTRVPDGTNIPPQLSSSPQKICLSEKNTSKSMKVAEVPSTPQPTLEGGKKITKKKKGSI